MGTVKTIFLTILTMFIIMTFLGYLIRKREMKQQCSACNEGTSQGLCPEGCRCSVCQAKQP